MVFKEWIATQGLTQQEAANLLHITQAAVSFLCNRRRTPSLPLMRKISVLTDDEVQPQDFVDD
jgi:predicted transcriptional regulator